MNDQSDYPIEEHFESAIQFVHEAISNEGKVFVHCARGISRSASVVIAYLIARDGKSVDDALETVRAARPMVNPNLGFVLALEQFSSRCARRCLLLHPPKSFPLSSSPLRLQQVCA